jgi:hypothetical protein
MLRTNRQRRYMFHIWSTAPQGGKSLSLATTKKVADKVFADLTCLGHTNVKINKIDVKDE